MRSPFEMGLIPRNAWIYAFPASLNALNTFSGLNGNVLIRTPVAL
jgi:hypothetical protein